MLGTIDFIVHYLKKMRSDVIYIMSGLCHNTNNFYKHLCEIVEKIDIDIKYYSNLEVE